MGFWDAVGKVAGAAMSEVKQANERTRAYKMEMIDKSDSELARIIQRERGSTPLKAAAAMQELKSRGFDEDTIKNMVRNA